MNITDVEDKIINKSKEQGIPFLELTQFWENDFFEDMKALDVEKPDYLSRVSEYIPEIIAFIDRIVENGYAYESKGDVYFNIEAYRKKFQYGKLKRIKDAETEAEEKDENNIKKNKEDFALWKSAKEG
jgi:cysteinyl-tRNA synthetase